MVIQSNECLVGRLEREKRRHSCSVGKTPLADMHMFCWVRIPGGARGLKIEQETDSLVQAQLSQAFYTCDWVEWKPTPTYAIWAEVHLTGMTC